MFTEGITFSDFFSHGRAIFFTFVAFYMAYRIFWEAAQRRLFAVNRTFLILSGIFALGLCVSTIFAANTDMALWGGYQRFEGFFVKLGYLITAWYGYIFIREKEHFTLLWKGLEGTAAVECVIGLLQIAGHDPIFWKATQKLIIPAEYQGTELVNRLSDNRVYLTFFNPNDACIYLAVMVTLFTSKLLLEWNFRLALLDAACFAEMIATRSRIGLFMLFIAALVLFFCFRSQIRVQKKFLLIGVLLMFMLFVVTDAFMGFSLSKRILATGQSFVESRTNCRLESLETQKDAVYFQTDSVSAHFYIDGDMDQGHIRLIQDGETGQDLSSLIEPKTGKIQQEGFENIFLYVAELDDEPILTFTVDESEFYFTCDADDGYLIYAGNGVYEKTAPIEAVDFHGHEHIASGRLYIWSRTIPLLKHTLLFGCGPDHFYLAFPQNDYVGKARYASSPYTIVEKPHNTLLLYGVELGLIAALAFILLSAFGIKSCFRGIRGENNQLNQLSGMLLLALSAYLTAYLFNDTSVVTSPPFWAALGIGIRMGEGQK